MASPPKTRLYFACGLAELLACAWLRENHFGEREKRNVLIIYGQPISMPPAHRAETLQLAPLFADWDGILDLPGDGARAFFDHKGLFSEADEIVLHNVWKDIERSFAASCPNAAITLYDNGLDSHTDVSVRNVSRAVSGRFALESDLARVKTAYYTLGDILPLPSFISGRPIIVPSGESLRDTLLAIAERGILAELRGNLGDTTGAATIVAGTAFYRTKGVTLQDERAVYARYVAACGAGALFKEHPRGPEPIFGHPFPGNMVHVGTSIPLEFIPLLQDIERCASISSTSLLTMKKIHGIGFDLLGNELHGALNLPWMPHLRAQALSVQ
jgi:hypothetical protein